MKNQLVLRMLVSGGHQDRRSPQTTFIFLYLFSSAFPLPARDACEIG
jgi:hypothetical protein